eukprot:CAMPEP_0117429130 /NCGR_PEP_ID=MMETSP0758-20121206/8701_1 /TAXON_ID=63605 /ORGANISM="Percolomonas cosmopolitus, Strain AE-1 (ATCC 50343)" /LENGTH=115 /DNA_ID=CAMNT_0005215905 /DNA_START=206 /DNA_END=550 /DNA_ORIENTATION=+
MTAGKWEYHWKDGKKKAQKLPAHLYIKELMEWIESLVNDSTVFPEDPGEDGKNFPKDFPKTVKKIFTRLFRVYAHIYYSHFEQVQQFNFERHLNTSLQHFILFSQEFNIVDKKDL